MNPSFHHTLSEMSSKRCRRHTGTMNLHVRHSFSENSCVYPMTVCAHNVGQTSVIYPMVSMGSLGKVFMLAEMVDGRKGPLAFKHVTSINWTRRNVLTLTNQLPPTPNNLLASEVCYRQDTLCGSSKQRSIPPSLEN